MIDKDKVRVLYLRGYNAVEIAGKIGAGVEATRKCIQRNFWSLKKQHDEAVKKIQREIVRAVNYESKKYISDRSFIQKNRNAYKTLPDGDIVIDRNVVPNPTWDMPKRLVNPHKNT